jgi:hypothetical protein
MNIFFSSSSPQVAAWNLDNKRVVKMVLESCQLLSNSMYARGLESPYGPTHEHHPCSLAVQYELMNYNWLLFHFQALLKEYTFRYGKTHKCEFYLQLFKENPPDGTMSKENKLSFPNCTPFKSEPDIIKAYQMCLLDKWSNDTRKPSWSGPTGSRNPPDWAIDSPWFTLYSKYEITKDD